MSNWLTRIEKLPAHLIGDCQWLFDRIKERRTSQQDLLAEFNRRLAEVGEKAISSSALSRYVARVRMGEAKRPELVSTMPEWSDEVLTVSAKTRLAERLGEPVARRVEALLLELISVTPPAKSA